MAKAHTVQELIETYGVRMAGLTCSCCGNQTLYRLGPYPHDGESAYVCSLCDTER